MVHHYYTGDELAAATIRREIPGHSARGETTANELSDWLNDHGVRANREAIDHATVRDVLRSEIDAVRPVIVLGRWVDPTILHWVVAMGYGNDGLIVMDPWTGTMRVFRWRTFYQLVSDVMVKTTRSSTLSTP